MTNFHNILTISKKLAISSKGMVRNARAKSLLLVLVTAMVGVVFSSATAAAAPYGGCNGCSIIDEDGSLGPLAWAWGNAGNIWDSTNAPFGTTTLVNVEPSTLCGSGGVVTSTCPYVVGSSDNADQEGKQLVSVSFNVPDQGRFCAYSDTDTTFSLNSNCNTVSTTFELIDNTQQLISVGGTNYFYNKLGDKKLYTYACGQNANNVKIIWTADLNGDCHWSIEG